MRRIGLILGDPAGVGAELAAKLLHELAPEARDGAFDSVLTMYHDQGQIAIKRLGFSRGVTLLGGLPMPVTTPAQGTAYDIAGKGVASAEALRHALMLAQEMTKET